jgi:hypothetical protein
MSKINKAKMEKNKMYSVDPQLLINESVSEWHRCLYLTDGNIFEAKVHYETLEAFECIKLYAIKQTYELQPQER